ncbi:hypothetical protein ACLIA0_10070 [Bacillaceae bacterium W0354]
MLKEYNISNARANLSNVFDDVQNFIPSLIKRRKKNESDGVFLNRTILLDILEKYTFTVDMKLEEDGHYWAWIEPLKLYANGATEEDCRESAVEVVQEFAEDFIEQPIMFQSSNTKPFIPYLFRVLLCDSPKDVMKLLFGENAEV